MTKFAYTNVGLWVAGFDVSGDTNKAAFGVEAPTKPVTTFGDGAWEAHIVGVPAGALSYDGFLDHSAADIDGEAFNNIGTAVSVSLLPQQSATPTVGDVAWLFKPPRTGTNIDLKHGEPAAGGVSGSVSGPVIRGRLMVPKAAHITSATGTSSQAGAVTATQKVYAALHVFAVSGASPTLNVVGRSDDNSGMTTPTTRLTFAQATGVTSEWMQLAGAITDDYWDFDFTIGGASPSFTFGVTLGIA